MSLSSKRNKFGKLFETIKHKNGNLNGKERLEALSGLKTYKSVTSAAKGIVEHPFWKIDQGKRIAKAPENIPGWEDKALCALAASADERRFNPAQFFEKALNNVAGHGALKKALVSGFVGAMKEFGVTDRELRSALVGNLCPEGVAESIVSHAGSVRSVVMYGRPTGSSFTKG